MERMRRWTLGGGCVLTTVMACTTPPSEVEVFTETAMTDGGSSDAMPTDGSLDTTASSDGMDDTDDGGSTGEPPDPDPGDPFDPPPPIDPLPADRLAMLQAAIDSWLADPAVSFTTQGVLIVDPAADQVLYARNPDDPRIPASNTKLFSTAVALDALDEEHRLLSEVWAEAPIDGDGVVAGALHLLGHHDFSPSVQFYEGAPRTSLDLLATQLYDAGLREVTGGITARGEFVYDGNSLGTYNPATERNEAAARFRDALTAQGITVGGATSSVASFEPPAGATMVGQWESPPLSVTAVPINVSSHNEFADILLRHVGWELGGTSDYPTGAAELNAWMGALGLGGGVFNDGSGLSHGNQVSPAQVIGLLEEMTRVPAGVAWRRTFSIAGVRGTLGGRMLGDDTRGRVHGKTGTLTGTIATSGVIYNRWDDREYLFSILMNNTGGSNSATRAIHDAVIGEVAADIRGRAAPPATPVLRVATHEHGTTVVSLAWDAVDGAEGYLVWLSADGLVWSRDDARYVTSPEHRAGSLPFVDPRLFVRISAVGPQGEGEPSDVYSAWAQDSELRALVVDGNDRWQAEPQPENPLGRGHDFAAVHARALASTGLGWDSVANEAVIDGEVSLDDYALVVWVLGEESSVDETFDAAEQGLVSDYLTGGGALFVSGAEIGWDLANLGDANDAQFYTDVLHAQYVDDTAGTYVVRPQGVLADLPPWGFFTPGTMDIEFADRIDPGPGAQTLAGYTHGLAGGAAVFHPGPGAVFHLALPFESIDNGPDRAVLMERAVMMLLD